MGWRPQINERGVIARFSNSDTGEVISAQEYERRMQTLQGGYTPGYSNQPAFSNAGTYAAAPFVSQAQPSGMYAYQTRNGHQVLVPPDNSRSMHPTQMPQYGYLPPNGANYTNAPAVTMAPPQPAFNSGDNPLIQPGAQILSPGSTPVSAPISIATAPSPQSESPATSNLPRPALPLGVGISPTAGTPMQGKNLRLEGMPGHIIGSPNVQYKPHGFLDATSIAILLPTLLLVALSIAAAHKKRLFPWQTIRTFNPPSGLMSPRDYEKSYLCPPNLRRHGRLGKRNPNATWTEADGVVLPFGFLARTHLPITIPLGRLPNKNMFIVAPSGSGKTTLMRAIMKALLAKPCVIIALEAKANDPNLDEKREGFKYTVLPEATAAGFNTLYFNPLDTLESVHWNPLDLPPTVFASSIVQDINMLAPEEQHWAERDHGYINGLTQLLKWGAVQVAGEDSDGYVSEVTTLPCNPRGLMKLVNNRRNIVESLRRLKDNPEVDPAELSELTQTLSSIIRTDTDWDKNIQGVRGRLRMFKNQSILNVTEHSNVDIQASMHKPTVLIFGAPAALGPDAESLASCFVYQLQQALHTRYGTVSVLPLFAFFDEYQTLNLDTAGRLSAIVRGANGGLTVILQNVSQIATNTTSSNPSSSGSSELRTIFSNAAVRVCLHNADETTARFFSDEIGKQAVIVPGLSDHFQANGFGVFPTSWNRIHSQQVVARVDSDAIKRMEKQHALVYLSPAGDPEFGEVKPLMVDLRGIEEIARLHLLHNVSSRSGPPSGDGTGSAVPAPPTHVPWQSNLTQSASWRPAPAEANTAENIAASAPSASTTAVGKLADELTSGIPDNINVITEPVAGALTDGASTNSVTTPKHIEDNLTHRICPACKQPATNKKFCTNCGAFLGQPASSVDTAGGEISANQPLPNSIPVRKASGGSEQRVELETSAALVGQNRNQSKQQAAAAPPPFPFAPGTPSIKQIVQGMATSDPQQMGANSASITSQLPNNSVDSSSGQTNPVARKPVTSFNTDFNRPVPKSWGNESTKS